jgi:hypothetical protein
MSTSTSTLKFARQFHRYLGIFIAPALLFFAFTGCVQTLSLHESSRGSTYKPTTFLATLAQIHKNQTWVLRKPQALGDRQKADGGDKPRSDKPARSADTSLSVKTPDAPAPAPTALPTGKWKMHWPLKIFFLIVSFGLFLSTLTGIYMALKYGGSKLLVWLLLLAGTILPLVLLPF